MYRSLFGAIVGNPARLYEICGRVFFKWLGSVILGFYGKLVWMCSGVLLCYSFPNISIFCNPDCCLKRIVLLPIFWEGLKLDGVRWVEAWFYNSNALSYNWWWREMMWLCIFVDVWCLLNEGLCPWWSFFSYFLVSNNIALSLSFFLYLVI